MALPVNIEELITGKTVEWERIEFRKGWNPERTLKSICAFANDFNNWGGGYIIIGIEEKNGKPVLPPFGLTVVQIDSIQKDLIGLCRKIIPFYFPIVEPVDFQGKKILILWCPGGSIRPYKAPDSLAENPKYFYFIRKFSSTVRPTYEEEKELISMANQVPFDDRVNHFAEINDLDLTEIRVYLNEVKSDLEKEIANLTVDDIARRMNIAEGGNENLLPKNVGLLFFSKNTNKYFPSAKIEVVIFNDVSGTDFFEKIFDGPIHRQLKDALAYLNANVVDEKVVKLSGRAEADRFFNYPYLAIEEALANAIYHRGYDNDSPIEVRVFPDRIDIISFPGPLPPLNKNKLMNLQIDVRKYRNRRIGEFLKELHLTEGRSTGIPTILRELEKNNSPKPIFETDDERSYFKTTLKIHPEFLKSQRKELSPIKLRTKLGQKVTQDKLLKLKKIEEIVPSLVQIEGENVDYAMDYVKKHFSQTIFEELLDVLETCISPQNRGRILSIFNKANNTRNYKNYIVPLINNGLLKMTIPDKPKSPNQKYRTTEKGIKLLEILNRRT